MDLQSLRLACYLQALDNKLFPQRREEIKKKEKKREMGNMEGCNMEI